MTLMLLEHEEIMLQLHESSSTGTQRRRYFNRERESGHDRLFHDYFSDEPVYPDDIFRWRFRMRRELFLRIVNALQNHSEYFQLRRDATGRKGLSPLQKCTAAIRQLAYGAPADHYDEYLRRYGFPEMLGSLDCMHWEWRNCPIAWKGQFTRGDHGIPTIVLEAGNAPHVNFMVNGSQYTKGYYLTDGIYPEWANFVKSFSCPEDPKRKMFKERQKFARKDVERAFGVLQSHWAMIRGPGRF
ncbi:uncharacterized protein [Henckelia pumila]|uniref:uncharacterized protein n=1 Tax=Henckelia pumila TaxID=405737 RepID=UPI003C6E08CC